MISLDAQYSSTVNASSVTTIGTFADVNAVYAAGANGTILGLGNEAITMPGPIFEGQVNLLTVAQANTLAAQTTGVVTATIETELLGALTGLTETGNAYTVSGFAFIGNGAGFVASVAASQLITLDSKTTVAVDVSAATIITGTAAEINAVYAV